MRITSVSSTYCFVTAGGQPAQVVRVAVAEAPPGAEASANLVGRHLRAPGPWRGRLDPARAGQPDGPAWAPGTDPGLAGPGRFTPSPEPPDGVVVELPVIIDEEQHPGDVLPVRASVEVDGARVESEAEVVVREPGWRMIMVSHFHYDPVWWNTQAGYTAGWDELLWAQDRRETFQHTGLTLVEAHLQRARLDPDYKFVLAEVDYLKPFWDLYPDRREELRALIRAERLEIVGGTHNEPNTNLTGAETAIRAVVYGLGFQREVLGADPRSAWQLDVFGHDPQFPGIMADCGLDSAAWARGPFHQWGPHQHTGSNTWMQFPSEFEWIAPNGRGLLTSYMPNHYSTGWELERATTLEGAMWRAYELFCDLAEVAATQVTLLPVGTDYTPPSRFVTDLARTWGARYTWPRFEVGLPREFFSSVRAELSRRGKAPSPQTRDMNPIYTGKDVSFIDTKQAQRLAETRLADAETLAALASLLGAPVPLRALDKAWRQLVFGAHHDGITGSESDQVYLDLLGGWRESYELARQVEEVSRLQLVAAINTTGEGQAVVVTNTLGQDRSDLVCLEVPTPPVGQVLELTDEAGDVLPVVCENGQGNATVRLHFATSTVPGIGYRSFRLRHRHTTEGAPRGWSEAPGLAIANEHFEVLADPDQGGGLVRVTDRSAGFELVPEGEVANELLVYPEYPEHPRFGEGPWNLLPSGPPARSGRGPAGVRRERSALGERLVVEGNLDLGEGRPGTARGEGLRYRQVVTLWKRSRRIELRTELHNWAAKDKLVRLRFPTTLAGATPVSAVGDAVVARGYALIDVDSAENPWTLDNPAAEWFGLSTTLVVEASHGGLAYHSRAVGVAEVVTGPGAGAAPWARDLVVALLQKGVTATCSEAQNNRYGALLGDSNLPDFRIAVGGPAENPFVATLLGTAGPAYRAELEDQLARQAWARLLVPAQRPLVEVWCPGADLRDARALPVLVVAGSDQQATEGAVADLVAAVTTGRVVVDQPSALVPNAERAPDWTVAILNRGTPGFAVDSAGALHVSLLRACSGWPSGVWIDPPRRTAPDGSAFELEHWSHAFEHAVLLGQGDWRQIRCVEDALAYNRPLMATLVGPHTGPLPPSARLLSISQPLPGEARGRGAEAHSVTGTTGTDGGSPDRPGRVVLAALKPACNPLASGDPTPAPDGPGQGVELALRCYETHGQAVEVGIRSRFHLLGAQRANLIEEPGERLPLSGADDNEERVRLALAPGELTTLRLNFARGVVVHGADDGAAGVVPKALGTEAAQPVFSRYWLHNKGAAPMGNQALAVHVLATALTVRAGDVGDLNAQVSSGSAHATQAGRLELVAPEGWGIDPPSRLFSLAPGAFVQLPVSFRAPERCRPGRYFIAARVLDASGQAQEDVVTVDVLPPLAEAISGHNHAGPHQPTKAEPQAGAAQDRLLAGPVPFGHPSGQLPAELEATLDVDQLTVPAGATATLGLRLANRTAGELRGEVQLVSPVETWPCTDRWAQGFTLAPGQEDRVEVAVRGPVSGWLSSWALFKVTYFGRLWYSPAVPLRLGDEISPAAPPPHDGISPAATLPDGTARLG